MGYPVIPYFIADLMCGTDAASILLLKTQHFY
jgi:hypothetical protein